MNTRCVTFSPCLPLLSQERKDKLSIRKPAEAVSSQCSQPHPWPGCLGSPALHTPPAPQPQQSRPGEASKGKRNRQSQGKSQEEIFMRAKLASVSWCLVFLVGDTSEGGVRVRSSLISKNCLLLQLFVWLATGRIWACLLFSHLIFASSPCPGGASESCFPFPCPYCCCSLFFSKSFSLLLIWVFTFQVSF